MFALSKHSRADSLQLDTTLEGKSLHVTISKAAQRALVQRSTPLIAEMELYFSCLIRLRVRFYEHDEDATATPVNAQLSVRFRPVMSRSCDLHEVKGKPPLGDFPIVKRAPYVPRWLHLDYKKGEWVGEFGYTSTNQSPGPPNPASIPEEAQACWPDEGRPTYNAALRWASHAQPSLRVLGIRFGSFCTFVKGREVPETDIAYHC